jgi:hypothetical protein
MSRKRCGYRYDSDLGYDRASEYGGLGKDHHIVEPCKGGIDCAIA